jgi:mono/diheme cytochrome c family protein
MLPVERSAAMIEFVYQILTKFGYTHPLHPTLTHVPIGMVIGAFLFALAALIFRWTTVTRTARHCVILALIVALPTTLLGIMDWQHFYGGALIFPIKMKLVLAGVLLIFLTLAVIVGFFGEKFSTLVLALYALCLLSAVGLGYFGGELVYGTKASVAATVEDPAAEGAMVFQQNCSACHLTDSTAQKIGPGLKGIFKQDKFPVSGQPLSEENFKKLLQKPFDKMPPFGHLTPEQVDALTAYLKTL